MCHMPIMNVCMALLPMGNINTQQYEVGMQKLLTHLATCILVDKGHVKDHSNLVIHSGPVHMHVHHTSEIVYMHVCVYFMRMCM